MLHIGMSLLLTMPYERGVYLPPETMGSQGHTFGTHLEHPLWAMVATPCQVVAFDFAVRTVPALSELLL